jgi:TRAP-type C4-dicarboxylate transport system substrate-binding protein
MIKLRSSLLLTAVLLALLPAGPVAAQTFKIATIAPEGSSWMKDMRAGAEVIQSHTEGRVKFKFYGGGVQGNDKQVQRKMRTGQLHGGAFTSGGMGRFQKDADLLSLPLLFDSIEEARHVRGEIDAVLRGRLEEAGYVNFGFAAAGFAYMMSNKPLLTSADLQGQKIWIPEGDRVGFAALQALGIAPVVMPVTDVMTGLQTDLLDSVAVPPVGAVVLQWHTRLEYITDMPLAYVYAALLIDRRAFDRMREEDRAVVREVMEGIYRKFDQYGVADNQEAMQALLDIGLKKVTPEAGQVEEWRATANRSLDELAAGGQFDPALLSRIRQLLRDYREAGGAPSAAP